MHKVSFIADNVRHVRDVKEDQDEQEVIARPLAKKSAPRPYAEKIGAEKAETKEILETVATAVETVVQRRRGRPRKTNGEAPEAQA